MVLANKPSPLQNFPHSKFVINLVTGSKFTAQRLLLAKNKSTFGPVVRLIPNFECGKICLVDGLFASGVFKNYGALERQISRSFLNRNLFFSAELRKMDLKFETLFQNFGT